MIARYGTARLALVVATATLTCGIAVRVTSAATDEGARSSAAAGTTPVAVHRADPGRLAPEISPAEQDELLRGQLASREAIAAREAPRFRPAQPEPPDTTPETQLAPSQQRASTSPTLIRRNNRNTVASDISSLLPEPAAANDAGEVFYMGNTYGSRSTDNGLNWVEDPLPAGPPEAPFPAGDPDVVHHRALDTTFSGVLDFSTGRLRGAVTIAVRNGTIGGGIDCLYDIIGEPNQYPDYPHLAVGRDYLYVSTNDADTAGTVEGNDDTWAGSRMIRLDASEMASCAESVGGSEFRVGPTGVGGQRVFVPVEGATNTIYWGYLEDTSHFRIFRWRESSDKVTQHLRSLPHATSNANPDCRGGIANLDWIEGVAGFELRGAVAGPSSALPDGRLWFVWTAAPDASHPQAHIHTALFRTSDLSLIDSPSISNSGTCLGYAVIGSNSEGDFGLTLAAGGRNGGGGTAAQGHVTVDDESTTGNLFGPLVRTATGTHNPVDARFGDYFTIRRDDRCTLAWVATNYSFLRGNTSSSHVNARYVEFGSEADAACF